MVTKTNPCGCKLELRSRIDDPNETFWVYVSWCDEHRRWLDEAINRDRDDTIASARANGRDPRTIYWGD